MVWIVKRVDVVGEGKWPRRRAMSEGSRGRVDWDRDRGRVEVVDVAETWEEGGSGRG